LLTGLLVLSFSAAIYAGTLTPGKPIVESDHYEVPINLRGAGDGVAALDFSLAYDPAVFQPVSISPGAAATAAGKLVTANLPEPGKYIVVMMGFNQTSVTNGEIARIALKRVGDASQGETRLAVNDPTLSTLEGVAVPVEGGVTAVTVAPKEEKPSDGDGTKPVAEKPERPTTTAGGEAPGAKPRGNARVAVAPGADGKPAMATPPVDVPVAMKAPASDGVKAENAVPNVAAAAAKAAEERNRLGDVPAGSQTGTDTKTASVAVKQDGQAARAADMHQTPGSLKIETSGTVNNNTAESSPPDGEQRASAVSGGWMRLGLAAAVLLAVAGVAWMMRSRIFR